VPRRNRTPFSAQSLSADELEEFPSGSHSQNNRGHRIAHSADLRVDVHAASLELWLVGIDVLLNRRAGVPAAA
jgi:hypothetical protein